MDSAEAKIAIGGSPNPARTAEPLTLRIKLLYGAPSFAGAAMIIPIFIHMPKFYADVVLVPLGYLAMAIAIARSLDALSDPLMGWISDHTHTRLGRRRPYMLIGAPLCGVAFFCLLNPPHSLTGGRAAIWFGVTFILYFIFHTVYVLPHYALGPELTQNYHDRSTLFAWRESFTILGTIVAAAAPGIMMQAFHLTERQVFFRLGIFFGVMLSVLYGLLVLNIKERADFVARESNPLVPGVRRALRNRPFGILLASYVVGSISGAIPATMMPFFNAYVIRPANPTFWLSMLLLGYFAFGFMSLPMWVAIARRVGKLNAYLASFFLGITGGGAMFLLGPGDTWWLLVLICWAGIGFGAGLFLTPSMQADVIDYDELYTGKRREAQYTAFWSMLPKFVAIPSAAIPIAVLASLGYIPNARPGAARRLRDSGDLRAGAGDLLRTVVPDRAPVSNHGNDPQPDPRRRQASRARRGGRRSNDRRARAAADARPRRGCRLVPRLLLQRRAEALSRPGRLAAGARRADRGRDLDWRVGPLDRLRAASRQLAQHRSRRDDFADRSRGGARVGDLRVSPDAPWACAPAGGGRSAGRRRPRPSRPGRRSCQRGNTRAGGRSQCRGPQLVAKKLDGTRVQARAAARAALDRRTYRCRQSLH